MTTYLVKDAVTGRPIVVQVPQTHVQVAVPPPKIVYPPENPLMSVGVPMLTLVFTAVAAATGGYSAWFAAKTYKSVEEEKRRRPRLRLYVGTGMETTRSIATYTAEEQWRRLDVGFYLRNEGDKTASDAVVIVWRPAEVLTPEEAYQRDVAKRPTGLQMTTLGEAATSLNFEQSVSGSNPLVATVGLTGVRILPRVPAANRACHFSCYAPVGQHTFKWRVDCAEDDGQGQTGELLLDVKPGPTAEEISDEMQRKMKTDPEFAAAVERGERMLATYLSIQEQSEARGPAAADS